MLNTMTHEMLYLMAASAVSIAAARSDLATRRISNRLTGASAVFGLAMHWLLDGLPGMRSSVMAGLALGAIFLMFYVAGGMGAGDVKLMFAVGCLSGIKPMPIIATATVISGMLLALSIAIHRRQFVQTIKNTMLLLQHHAQHGLHMHGELNIRNEKALNMPLAVPIAAGCLVSVGIEMAR